MSETRVSSENLHATTVALDGRAVLIAGPSGSGKSDLALRLLDHGFALVSDDRTIVSKEGGRIVGRAPLNIRGKLEIRGIGIVEMDSIESAPIAMAVELTSDIERMPDEGQTRLLHGVHIPLIRIDAMTASAPAKVVVALDRLGLKD
nr:HPr kinase/phosphatase C-terminal domain-containing protein [uncultured Sphingomonas sp.]